MVLKGLLLAGVAAVCALSAPRGPEVIPATNSDPTARVATAGKLPTPEQFLALAESDPVAMYEACVRRYKQEVRGFRAVLHKQERVKDTLHPPEIVRVAVREEPFAVQMIWDSGIRDDVGGTVYAAGENGGIMTVWRPAKFIKYIPVNPKEGIATTASRYCVTDSSLSHSTYRSYLRWSYCRDRGILRYDFLGMKAIPEAGGRKCFVFRRYCVPNEIDNFSLSDPTVRDPSSDPAQAIYEITNYIDVELWLQIGSELKRADGQLIGSYWFRDVELNPTFSPNTFTPDGFKK